MDSNSDSQHDTSGNRRYRANIQYFVGDFDGDTFQCTEITDEPLWIDFGFDNYAGVTYGNYDRPVYLGWGVNPLYANFVPTGEYSGLMTLPRELSLCETDEGYRLKTKPFGIDEYRAGAFPIGNQKPLLTESFGLLVQGNFGRIALKNSRGEEVVIEVTVDSITVDRSKSGDLSYFEDVDPKLFKKRICWYLQQNVTCAEMSTWRLFLTFPIWRFMQMVVWRPLPYAFTRMLRIRWFPQTEIWK